MLAECPIAAPTYTLTALPAPMVEWNRYEEALSLMYQVLPRSNPNTNKYITWEECNKTLSLLIEILKTSRDGQEITTLNEYENSFVTLTVFFTALGVTQYLTTTTLDK